jgi:molybdopterin-guanine dinucleotide biosynthesis protein
MISQQPLANASAVGAPDAEARLVRVDKIASATVNLGLEHELEITTRCEARAGNVVVVRTLTDNATYNTLELVTGRMAKINPGDIIAGVLGYRRALKGFVGDVPESLKAGDRLHLLNLGGLIGQCLGHHHSLNNAIEVEVIGMPVREGRLLNISQGAIARRANLTATAPLVLVAGTCMNSGKTYAATEIIKHLTRAGLRVAAAKLSGVACLRDTLNMQDHGAVKTLSFLDCGLPSTVGVSDLAPVAKAVIEELATVEPDCVVIELGDGLLGGYSVETVFDDVELMRATAALVFCASDFVGAWGGRELLAANRVKIDVMSGPVTDSQMGADYISRQLGIPAANAVYHGEQLALLVKQKVEQWTSSRGV